MEEKSFPEVTGGGRYFFEYSERVRGLTLSCENGKSGRVGDLLKFPPWLVSGYFLETHICVNKVKLYNV